ncbi:E3 ubiquitin-protein ligase TRIM33-like [Dendronephthya gigantea]|uniref:E3 ubiquitin-protein ligase TRIM33-like n=1 Tax=Dendronephthya gigantea TaxID=151771 RepID=UPI00106D7150|nr:E3 ubiquitin-protein ligase TRIM33-like [Dendronephthya gigantea]
MANVASDNVPVDEINNLLTCSLCSKLLHDSRSLTCLHNFCRGCLLKYVERLSGGEENVEIFPCPTCRSEFTLKSTQDIAEMPDNCFIQNMLEIKEIQEKAKESAACSHCQDPAISHCASCEIFMCEKCSASHGRWLKNHDVLSVDELGNPESQLRIRKKVYCRKHQDKILEYYCETCKELCCIHCLVLNHQKQNHSCVAVSEITNERKETLQSSCTTLDEKLSEGKVALSNIDDALKSLNKNAKATKDQIKVQKENILKIVTEKLDERAKEMNEELDEVYDELHSELSKQRDEITDFVDKVQSSVALPKNLLKRGSIEEILSLQKRIDESIEKLKNAQPEDLTPVNDGDIQYLPDDIGNVNVDGIVGNLGLLKRMSSSILDREIALMKQLQKWLGEKCKWNLCYRASIDGWSSQDFHRHCDNKGPTVVLVKADDYIFGGYTDQNWDTSCAYKYSSSSFIFSLRNKDKLPPFIANIRQGMERYAIYCQSSFGPRFGGGQDWYTCDNPHVNPSCGNFGHTYQPPPGYVSGNTQTTSLLAGQYSFLTTEIEVFN